MSTQNQVGESMRIHRQTAPVRTLVAKALREAIRDQRFVAGQRLLERELCDLTGVSRTSVREALRQLESEGLVQSTPQGPVVATMTVQEARELYQVRAVLEGLAGSLSADHATPEDIGRMRELIDELEALHGTDNIDELLRVKDEFYRALFAAAGNRFVEKVLDGLRERVSVLRSTTLSTPSRLPQTVHELRGIVDAIATRDAASAERICRDHVESAARVALQVLESATVDDG